MKKTAITCILGALALSFLAPSCSDTGAEHLSASFEAATASAKYRLQNSAREYGTEEDILYSESINVLMPVKLFGADVKGLRDSIVKLAFDTAGCSLPDAIDAYVARTVSQYGYKVCDADSLPTDGTSPDGFTNITGAVVNLTPEILVYCVTTDEYRPRAAHGLSTNYYLNFDINGSRVLTFAEIFDSAKTDSLAAAIQTQADALEQVLGPTTITALPAGNNFMLSPSGEIVFVYQPYEVASFAQGAIRVSFYPYELSQFMTPAGAEFFNVSDLTQQ